MRKQWSPLWIIIVGLFGFSFGLIAQEKNLVLHKSFDNESISFDSVEIRVSKSKISRDCFMPTYCTGVRGKALDLTDDIAVRTPVWVEKEETPDYSKNFSFSVWVQTKPGAYQGTAILGNKKNYCPRLQSHSENRQVTDDQNFVDESKAPGFLLGTTEMGGWYFYISDGKNTYTYFPTAERQRINDGLWHHLAMSLDWGKKELWLYFDGKNVAIYNVEDLTPAINSRTTVLGGADEFAEKGMHHSRGEWTAFNGRIDEVKFWNSVITSTSVEKEYIDYNPNKKDIIKFDTPDRIKVQVWNIWHGGRRSGYHVGLQRVIDVLKQEKADLIGLVETYGSGAVIADSLQYYYYLISDNLSILSRYPIESTIQLYKSFRSGGAILNLSNNKKLAFFDIWLDWRTDDYRSADIEAIDDVLGKYAAKSDKVPVIVVGDFNSNSHLDQFPVRISTDPKIAWPSKVMVNNLGFSDSFREMNKDSKMFQGYTWSPMNNTALEKSKGWNRVDYIYYRGKDLKLYRSEKIDRHPILWPSDHASVVSYFYLK